VAPLGSWIVSDPAPDLVGSVLYSELADNAPGELKDIVDARLPPTSWTPELVKTLT
jgi:hypothetical protein